MLSVAKPPAGATKNLGLRFFVALSVTQVTFRVVNQWGREWFHVPSSFTEWEERRLEYLAATQ